MGYKTEKSTQKIKYKRLRNSCLFLYSKSIATNEVQIKAPLRFHLTAVRIAEIKEANDNQC